MAQRALIGREASLERFEQACRDLSEDGTSYLWITGGVGCGKSAFLQAGAEQAIEADWEVLQGQCNEETRAAPYGPFLSMLGLCFDKSGKLINDRSVHSIVDQISLDDISDAIQDIPGGTMLVFGIKVGMTIFESRRHPQNSDELLNRNFEFIRQVLEQIGRKRKKPLLMLIDDLHLAGATTLALIEYILTRFEHARLFIAATWQAESAEQGRDQIHRFVSRLSQPENILYLPLLSDGQMGRMLAGLCSRPLSKALTAMLIELSRGSPKVLAESLHLIEQEKGLAEEAWETDTAHAAIQALMERQLAYVPADQRALLQCASLIGQTIPLDLFTAGPLGAYLGMNERRLLSTVVELADQGVLLTWQGEDAVCFASSSLYQFLRQGIRDPVACRDHERIAQAMQSVGGEAHPAQLAAHYLAGRAAQQALQFALQSADELMRSAAYPEAVQSYRMALDALALFPDQDEHLETKYDILRATSVAAEQDGDWEQALARLQEALGISQGDPARQAEIEASIGWLSFQRGEMQAALDHLSRSAGLYKSLDDAQGQAQVDYYLGMLYGQQKDWQRAIACFERYLETAQAHGFSEGRASAYIELGNLYRMQYQWTQAENLLQQGIELAQAEGDYAVLAQGYHYLGLCYAWQGQPQSVDMLHRALDIVHARTKQPVQEARIQNTLAETLVRQNRWAEAEAAFHASARLKERLGDKAGLAMTYGGLGRLYSRQWRFNLAVEHLQKDLDILAEEAEANVAWIQQLTNSIGQVLRLQGRLSEAERRFTQALSLADRIPDERVRLQSLGYTRMLLANLALDRDDVDAAAQDCAVALDLLAGTWAEGEVQRTAARLARQRGDLAQARQHMDKALAAAEKGEDMDRAQTFLEQAHLCRQTGDEAQAREWAERVVELARRLQNSELERRVERFLAR